MGNYLTESEKRTEWFNCLSAVDNWISNHSKTLKMNRMNNANGLRKVLAKFISDVDIFMEYQDDWDFTV